MDHEDMLVVLPSFPAASSSCEMVFPTVIETSGMKGELCRIERD